MDIVTAKNRMDASLNRLHPDSIFYKFILPDITLGSQKLCTENCAACGSADSVVESPTNL